MKYGILGGAFDPPHNAHVKIAEAALAEAGLDKIVFLPEASAPHKSVETDYARRREMLALALKDKSYALIDDFERENGGINYTADTLPRLKEKYGDIVFIIGGDSMADFSKWRNPEKIAAAAPIAVCAGTRRRDEAERVAEIYRAKGASIGFLRYCPDDISSRGIRLKKRLDMDISDCVAPDVDAYIDKNGLYAEYSRYVSGLAASVSKKTLAHSKRAVIYAFKLNEKLGLDCRKVFLAALLHDCAKGDDGEGRDIPSDAKGTPVAHAFVGALEAERVFGITDRDVLDAIYYHTTARPQMTPLDKLIYCADMLESGRNFEGVERLRDIISKDFDEGFLQCLKTSASHLAATGASVYPLTDRARDYYSEGNL